MLLLLQHKDIPCIGNRTKSTTTTLWLPLLLLIIRQLSITTLIAFYLLNYPAIDGQRFSDGHDALTGGGDELESSGGVGGDGATSCGTFDHLSPLSSNSMPSQ